MLLEENVERDAVHKALLSLLRQDVKGNLHYQEHCGTISICILYNVAMKDIFYPKFE